MILTEYDKIIREYFDISDNRTRKAIISLNEDSKQDQLLSALASALYDKIVAKVDKIDFGTIPKSRGDITKVEGFDNTEECIDIIRKMVVEYKEDTKIVDVVLTAIDNVKKLKSHFMRCFSLNVDFGITLYNLVVLAIEQSVSFLISVTIQYIKDPSSQTYSVSLDKAAYRDTMNNMLYQQLITFNKSCASGEVESALKHVLTKGKLAEAVNITVMDNDNKEVVKHKSIKCDEEEDDDMALASGEVPAAGTEPSEEPESEPTPTMPINGAADVAEDQAVEEGVLKAIALGVKWAITAPFKIVSWLIKVIIPMMRNITYFCISSIVSFSDALYVQAQLIEMNAYELQYSSSSDLDEDKKKKVVEKQLKVAEKLKRVASKFAINDKKAKKEAEKMAAEDEKKNTIDDVPVDTGDGSLF